MGCIFTKKPQSHIESKPTDSRISFWVETQLNDIPNFATDEWENLMRKNDMSMDQDNSDVAKDKFTERERIFQNRIDSFDEMRSNAEEQILDSRRSLALEKMFLKDESVSVQIRENNLMEKEDVFEEMRINSRRTLETEKTMLKAACCSVQMRETLLKKKEEAFEAKIAEVEDVMFYV
jgi:hypothetical protein